MPTYRVRTLCGLLLLGLLAAPGLYAQGPRGVGGDIKPGYANGVNGKAPRHHFHLNFNFFHFFSRHHGDGGGPGPAGAGVKKPDVSLSAKN